VLQDFEGIHAAYVADRPQRHDPPVRNRRPERCLLGIFALSIDHERADFLAKALRLACLVAFLVLVAKTLDFVEGRAPLLLRIIT